MKYLELKNNTDCLKIAKCFEEGISVGKKGGFYNQKLFGSWDGGFLLTNAGDEEEWIEFSNDESILIPIESLKLNPFRCLEHGVNIVRKNRFWHDKDPVKGKILSYKVGGFTPSGQPEIEIGGHGRTLTSDISLDLKNLPEGAKVIEISDE